MQQAQSVWLSFGNLFCWQISQTFHSNSATTHAPVGQLSHSTSLSFFPKSNPRTVSINRLEEDCDVIRFENIPFEGKTISRTFRDDVITYHGFRPRPEEWEEKPAIHLIHKKPQEVSYVGIAQVTDDLGNVYTPCGRGYSGQYDEAIEGYLETFPFPLQDFHPDATSISFKYLFARTILSFELGELPLPS